MTENYFVKIVKHHPRLLCLDCNWFLNCFGWVIFGIKSKLTLAIVSYDFERSFIFWALHLMYSSDISTNA